MFSAMVLAMSFLGAGQQVVLMHPLEVIVIDGDTIKAGDMRIRLSGIDAPEMSQPGGKQSREALKHEIATGTLITCRLWERDRYRRWVATCYNMGGDDLNWFMVDTGNAYAYRKYSLNYVAAEDHAKQGKRGVWRGEVEYPWVYRSRRTRRN